MVGVCLKVIDIIQIVIKSQGLTTLADDFLALDALFFLISCLLSYSRVLPLFANRESRKTNSLFII